MKTKDIIINALKEDLGEGDHTSMATIPPLAKGRARLLVKQDGILAGLPYVREVFHQVDPTLQLDAFMEDGSPIHPGDVVFHLEGMAMSIVAGERLALNILQRLSGIASYTYKLARLIEAWPAKLLDTRKTTPLLRGMEKYAVRMGGGVNHRMGLYDMIMIKDNHIDFSGGIRNAIHHAQQYLKRSGKNLQVEIEVRNFRELDEVLDTGGVNRIMLDNFSPADLARAVSLVGKRFETEASGGIQENNIMAYAATGVDYISIGALTHQVRSLDMSLKAF